MICLPSPWMPQHAAKPQFQQPVDRVLQRLDHLSDSPNAVVSGHPARRERLDSVQGEEGAPLGVPEKNRARTACSNLAARVSGSTGRCPSPRPDRRGCFEASSGAKLEREGAFRAGHRLEMSHGRDPALVRMAKEKGGRAWGAVAESKPGLAVPRGRGGTPGKRYGHAICPLRRRVWGWQGYGRGTGRRVTVGGACARGRRRSLCGYRPVCPTCRTHRQRRSGSQSQVR